MSRKYHFSYDVKNIKEDFNNDYTEARNYLICVLWHTPIIDINNISSYCTSTLIIEYEEVEPYLFSYLKINLGKYFFYSISLVETTDSIYDCISHDPNMSIDINLKKEMLEISCSDLGKEITPYSINSQND